MRLVTTEFRHLHGGNEYNHKKGWSTRRVRTGHLPSQKEYSLNGFLRTRWVFGRRKHIWTKSTITQYTFQRVAVTLLVGKPEGKRPLGRPRRRWEDNIKMGLQEVGEGCEGWMELAQDRDRWRALVSTVDEPSDSKNAGNFLTSCRTN